jgi:hypothetical protein
MKMATNAFLEVTVTYDYHTSETKHSAQQRMKSVNCSVAGTLSHRSNRLNIFSQKYDRANTNSSFTCDYIPKYFQSAEVLMSYEGCQGQLCLLCSSDAGISL